MTDHLSEQEMISKIGFWWPLRHEDEGNRIVLKFLIWGLRLRRGGL